MISFVRGRVAAVRPTEAVVDVGGVGLLLHCTPATTARLRTGESAQLAASLVVREDSLTLYGFDDDDERAVFELVQTASGVGPRLAQAMLAVYAPDELRRAVATEDLAALTKVPGIGKKGAQRIVIELKDKLGGWSGASGNGTEAATAGMSVTLPASWESQVQAALLGLGWSAREADQAVASVASTVDGAGPGDVATLLKAALQHLAKR